MEKMAAAEADLLSRLNEGPVEASRLSLSLRLLALSRFLRLLGEEDSLDVGQHSSLGDSHTSQELVELLVVANGQLEVPRDDPGLLVVPSRVPRQLQNLSGQILQHGREVHRCPGADSLRIVPLAEEPVDSAHRELEAGARRTGLGLGSGFASGFSSTRHVYQTDVILRTKDLTTTAGTLGALRNVIRTKGRSFDRASPIGRLKSDRVDQ